jgi:lipoprotein-anchoring transpeptidase ErfK/SrfK
MIPETGGEVRAALIKAVEAMRQKNKAEAFSWASRAARLSPNLEEPWLIMAAVSNPQASLQYLNHALQINPQSQKAKQGIIWATKRLEALYPPVEQTARIQPVQSTPSPLPVENTQKVTLKPPFHPSQKASTKRFNIFLFWIGLFVFFCVASVGVSAFATSWIMINSPASPVPVVQKISVQSYQTPTATAPIPPTQTPTQVPTPTLTSTPTETAIPQPTSTSSIPTAVPVVPAIPVTPLPTQPAQAYQSESSPPYAAGNGERWIDVNLSQQKLYAYEGSTLANSFLVSSGVAAHPTVTGQYRIYVKYRFDDMRGPGYFLPNVPYVLYFYEGYGIHGTYWHSNFGHPMSHGCVNLSIPDAAWIYDWASEGTLVDIHY